MIAKATSPKGVVITWTPFQCNFTEYDSIRKYESPNEKFPYAESYDTKEAREHELGMLVEFGWKVERFDEGSEDVA